MYLKILVRMGYNIKFIGDNFYRHEPYTSKLQDMGVEVLYGNKYASSIESWIDENKECFDLAFVNRPHITDRYISLLKNAGIKVVYFGHDLHFLRVAREASITNNKKLLAESEAWKKTELKIIDSSDLVYFPSSLEVSILRNDHGRKNAKMLPLFSYPEESWDEKKYIPEDRKGLLFVGGFGHAPNIDAVHWFHSNIFPKLNSGALPIRIVGSNAPESIKNLHSEDFQVLGYLPDEDLAKLYRESKVVFVPLRYGAGVKGKVLEAFYNAVPVIATSIALEGIVDAGSSAFEANTEVEFIEAINSLIDDDEKLVNLSKRSKSLINETYNESVIMSLFEHDFKFHNIYDSEGCTNFIDNQQIFTEELV